MTDDAYAVDSLHRIPYLEDDPERAANTGYRPGNKQKKGDPEDCKDGVLGHGREMLSLEDFMYPVSKLEV